MTIPSDLIDARGIAARYGIERSAADRIMQTLPKYRMPGVRRVWVSLADVEAAWEIERPIPPRRRTA